MITGIVGPTRSGLPKALFALIIGLTSLLQAAWAQTPVSGAIAVDTQWTTENAPYLVSGNLVVQNGATLTIAPGVTVYMASAASLTVQSGSVKAIGTADSTIRVVSDNVRAAQPAAPGDFGSWTFNAGASGVHLEHLLFQHGSGIQVRGTSPTFNYLDLRDNAGPAISIDLASSPSGVGNQASGNGVNGIDVPAGDVTGVVDWGVLGIPYVVRSGTVSVGRTPTISSVTPNVLQQGQTATIEVVGARLAGAVEAQFGEGISAEVLPGGTATRTSLSVTAGDEVEVGTADLMLLVDAGQALAPAALTIAQSQPTITSLQPDRVFVGQGDVEVAVSGRGFTSQSVALLNGAELATEYVGPSRLDATVPNHAAAANKTFRLRTPDPLAPGEFLLSNEVVLQILPAQIQVTPAPAQVVRGRAHPFTVELPYPAVAGGVQVTLVSSVPSVATVPASVLVPEGERTAPFELTAIANGSTVVTASRTGLISGQSTVTVTPPPTLSISPTTLTLGVGRSADITVTSSTTAVDDGLVVELASSDAASAQVAPQVTIPAGSSSVTATVTTSAVGEVTLTANAVDHVAGSATVHVRPVSINLPAATVVAPGLSRSIPVTLSDPAPVGGLEVTLQSADPALAAVPNSLHIPEGGTSGNFQLSGVAAGATSIGASGPGYEQGAMAVTVESIQIRVGSPAVTSISVPAEQSLTYPITLSRPAPEGGVVVALSTADPNIAAVEPARITIAAGETSGGVVRATLDALEPGTTSLVAESEGLQAATIPVTVRNKAAIRFSRTTEVVGKGLKNYLYSVYVQRVVDGQSFSGSEPLTVTLTSSDPNKVSVPVTVTIPAGQSQIPVQVTGIDLTDGVPVTIDAQAEGHTAPTTKLSVTAIAPVLVFNGLESLRSTGSVRDDFRMRVNVPGSVHPTLQAPAADITFDLSIVDASPAGIVPGFFSAATGDMATTQVIMSEGAATGSIANSTYSYIGTPIASGTYRVHARATGIAEGTSAVVTVSAPDLRFNRSSEVVGKGLKNYLYSVYVERVVDGQLFNGSEPLTVTLTSSDPNKVSVPVTVTIPAGQSQIPVQLTGIDLTDGVPVTIDAQAEGHTAPATKLSVTAIAPVLVFNGLESLRSTGSVRDDFRMRVNVPGSVHPTLQAPAADITFDLSIVDASPAGIVPGFFSAATGGMATTQVVMHEGTATGSISNSTYSYIGTPIASGTYRVHARATGIAEGTSAVVTVSAPALRFNRSSEVVGKGLRNYLYSVYVQRVAEGQPFNGSEPLTVTLTSSDPNKVSVPVTVTIPAGQSQIPVQVTGIDLTDGVPVTIDAQAEGHTAPATMLSVTAIAPVLVFNGLESLRSTGSVRDDFRMRVNVPGSVHPALQAPAADITFDLSIVDASPAGIVPGFFSAATGGMATTQVVMHEGTATGSIANSTYSYIGTPIASGTYRVHARATGIAEGTSAVVTVSAPALRFNRSSEVVGKGMANYQYSVYVQRVVDGQLFNGVEPLTVTLRCSSNAICTVPPSVVIPANASQVNFTIDGVAVGNTTISAEAVEHTSAGDMNVSVVIPTLQFQNIPSTVGVGSAGNVRVRATVPGAASPSSATALSPMEVSLTSSAPGVATVTGTLTIPVGNGLSGYGSVTGVASGSTTVTASGTDMNPATSSPITVSP